MDSNSNQLQLKKILVDLEDEHKHLQVSISHLEHEIKKREIEIQKLLSERELELAREVPEYRKKAKTHSVEHLEVEETLAVEYSSEFAKQVGQLLNNITKTSEEVAALIKL